MHRPLLVACVCCLICGAGLAQQRESDAIPDAPSPTQSETGPEATNPLQSGVAMFLTLQKKSVVFPDLATARGPTQQLGQMQAGGEQQRSIIHDRRGVIGFGLRAGQNQPWRVWPGAWRIR